MTYRLFYVSNYLMDKYNKDIIAINDVGVKSPNYDEKGTLYLTDLNVPLDAVRNNQQHIDKSYYTGSIKINDNCSAFYEPSYVIARAYQNGGF